MGTSGKQVLVIAGAVASRKDKRQLSFLKAGKEGFLGKLWVFFLLTKRH